MRTPDGYRFGLQFKILSDAHRQVGELLESLGNKKSEAVVTAMIEYINTHPEILNRDNPIKVITTYGYSEETLNKKIEEMIRRLSDSISLSTTCVEQNSSSDTESNSASALDLLLSGLEKFE